MFGVRSMSAPLRRVLLRRPAVTGDFAAAGWRLPDPGSLARQHEAFGQLLTDLFALPGVRIFQGVRQAAVDAPRIPHAVSAGHRLVLVESVA